MKFMVSRRDIRIKASALLREMEILTKNEFLPKTISRKDKELRNLSEK